MKLRKTSWLVISLTLILSLFLTACAGNTPEKTTGTTDKDGTKNEEAAGEPQKGGDLIIGSTGSPTLFNSLYSTDTASSDIESFIYDGLVTSDTEFNPTFSMAEDIKASEDGLTYTAKLKKGIKWHDGEEFTADDVVFTFMIPKNPDYVGERGSNFESLEKVTKIDDYTVEFKLSKRDASFYPVTLSYFILPEHILKDVPVAELGEHEFNTKSPIGTGPFKFVEWKDGEYVKVEAFDDYFKGRPNLDSLTYKIVPDMDAMIAQIQAGDIDFAAGVPGTDIETVKSFPGVKVESGLALSYTYLGYNQKNDLFKDKKVRQALTHAIDREAIVNSVMNGDGKVADVPESPLSFAYNDDVPKFGYDVEKAKSLLAEAGWKDTDGDGILDKDGKKFSFTVKTNQGNKVREDIVVVLQEQLKNVGIEAKPEIVEWSAFIEQISAPNWNYDALVLGWSLSTFPDQYDIFHSSQMKEGLNFVWYSNPEADKLMEEAKQILDQDEYKKAYADIYKMIAEDQPYTFLYYPNVHRVMPENLQGYVFHAKDDYYEIYKWWLKK
ncbi:MULTISPECIES: peptide-binding protein [Mesobacillus]|uniref:Peptide-binding protein n=2 Tax=Mesobacillus TaxID=2675231 RepID=A0A0D6ZBQ0_9BACI|nr:MULTISPECIES: peptide-binding protein [Mesobacillus]KIY22947.1 peptide-binding protein [Mesobacillus subterraneus]MDQ0413622.1 peptide/nickel transport system substrate-binding protein [Mesobacillus stamsii]